MPHLSERLRSMIVAELKLLADDKGRIVEETYFSGLIQRGVELGVLERPKSNPVIRVQLKSGSYFHPNRRTTAFRLDRNVWVFKEKEEQ